MCERVLQILRRGRNCDALPVSYLLYRSVCTSGAWIYTFFIHAEADMRKLVSG